MRREREDFILGVAFTVLAVAMIVAVIAGTYATAPKLAKVSSCGERCTTAEIAR